MNFTQEKIDHTLALGEQVFDFIGKGGALRELKNVDEKTMEAIYYVAYNLYQNAKYEDALKVFKFLGLYDHLEKKYLMGIGGCQQMLQQYKDAINSYSMAALLDISNPLPPLHAAECYLALGDFENAASGFSAALEFAGNQGGYEEVKDKATKMLALVKNKLS
ncbi:MULTISPECIES: SycD/LcrH family type III secretion system chaperone [Thalassomonas]|uniref:SycD/LcrH family type III secretion system chaperone n=1 Tax=Thalassomonas actiniarum TaxID=485447 RepID=A0AAE9YHX1_9GAMM|nr:MULTISPECIES: SycD/LcrH family type III secretion system chaperone [Thalassomonas]WDD96600.1 SycD/LcrH family type III secretion system chaperone [Thalassomonas actiniarum]